MLAPPRRRALARGAESTGYEDPFDTYTAFNPALVQVLHKPNFHWSKTVHANSLNSMSKAEAETELAGLKMHAEGKSDETAASKYFSRGPHLRQFIVRGARKLKSGTYWGFGLRDLGTTTSTVYKHGQCAKSPSDDPLTFSPAL